MSTVGDGKTDAALTSTLDETVYLAALQYTYWSDQLSHLTIVS